MGFSIKTTMHGKRLQGKNVLITGSSSGIGEATAIRFAEEGANVAINYHSNEEEGNRIKESVEQTCHAVRKAGCKDLLVKADISQEEDVSLMFQTVLKEWGRIDILINNAGLQKESPSHLVSLKDFDMILNTNLRGAYLCAKQALIHFLSRSGGGVILNNSSVHEVIPKPGYISYSLSKGGMENLTKTLALEYADKGIRVNAVGPGAILTPINPWSRDPKKRKNVESHIPMRRAGRPEEIAAVFAFLASDDASYITGQTVFVDGGLTLFPSFKDDWSSGGN